MKKIINHKHIPTRKYNNSLCLVCGTLIDCILISHKQNELLFEIEQYPMELFYNIVTKESNMNLLLLSSSIKDYQPNLKRKALIDRLLLIKKKLRLPNKVFHLTVYLFDLIILECEKAMKYDHIALGCLILAVKFLQNENEIPDMKQFEIKINEAFYLIDDLKRYEVYCVQVIKYKLDYVTPIDYIEYFASKGLLFTYELNHSDGSSNNNNNSSFVSTSINTSNTASSRSISNNLNANTILSTIHEVLLKVINRISYSTVSTLHIACSCLCLARELNGIKQKWNPVFASVYKTQFSDFEHLYELIKQFYNETQKASFAYSKIRVPSKISTAHKDDINPKSGDFFSKKRKQRTLSLGVNSSFLNQYIKQNRDSFHNKERVKQHSNESNCKKETAQSITATPENIPIIPLRKYKYQNMNYPNVQGHLANNNLSLCNSKLTVSNNNNRSINNQSKLQDFLENNMLVNGNNTTDKINESKNASKKLFKGFKVKNNKDHLNNSLAGTSEQMINVKNVITSYCKSTNTRKQRTCSGGKNSMLKYQ